MMQGIRNIVFDLGGVLVDLNREACLKAFRALGYDRAEEMLDNYTQKGFFRLLEVGEMSEAAFCERIRSEIGRKVSDDEIKAALCAFVVDIPAYKLTMLSELKKRYRILMLTNTNPIVMNPILSVFFKKQGKSVMDYFDVIFRSDEMGLAKPDPEIFARMMRQADLVPEETLYLDDAPANIEMARRFDVRTMLITPCEDFRSRLVTYSE